MILEILAVLAVVVSALLAWALLARLFPPRAAGAATRLARAQDQVETVRRSATGFKRRSRGRA
jgi:hypothetical protein